MLFSRRRRFCPQGHDKGPRKEGEKLTCLECRHIARLRKAGVLGTIPARPAAGDRCAVCGEVPRRRLDADHSHATGAFRGYLCGRCNKTLGLVEDSPELLRALAAYLKETK